MAANLRVIIIAAIAAATAIMDPLHVFAALSIPPPKRRKDPAPTLHWFTRKAPLEDDASWRSDFRVSRDVFQYIANAIRDHTSLSPSHKGVRSTTVEALLGCFLFAMGQPTTVARVASKLEVAPNTVVRAMRCVPRAIIDCLGYNLAWPEGPARARVKQLFSDAGFPGAVGIIDCTHVEIVPNSASRRDGSYVSFLDRKCRYSKVYQVVVAPDLTILDISGGMPGSANDANVLRRSALYTELSTYLQPGEYLLGDC